MAYSKKHPVVVFHTKRLLNKAEKYAEHKGCDRCSNKKLKVVPLFEYGDMFFPSKIVLFCKECKHNTVFADMPVGQANEFAAKLKALGLVDLPQDKVDSIIQKDMNGIPIIGANKPTKNYKNIIDEVA